MCLRVEGGWCMPFKYFIYSTAQSTPQPAEDVTVPQLPSSSQPLVVVQQIGILHTQFECTCW